MMKYCKFPYVEVEMKQFLVDTKLVRDNWINVSDDYKKVLFSILRIILTAKSQNISTMKSNDEVLSMSGHCQNHQNQTSKRQKKNKKKTENLNNLSATLYCGCKCQRRSQFSSTSTIIRDHSKNSNKLTFHIWNAKLS